MFDGAKDNAGGAKLLIVGRSASGKDALAEVLRRDYGMKFVKSYTSRPRRFPSEDTHIFVSPEEAAELVKDAVAKTSIDGKLYFATRSSIEDSDAYIIDPKGLFELVSGMPDTPFAVVYLSADDEAREKASMARVPEERQAVEREVFRSRCADERAQFCAFEDKMRGKGEPLPANICSVREFINDYEPDTLEKIAAAVTSPGL